MRVFDLVAKVTSNQEIIAWLEELLPELKETYEIFKDRYEDRKEKINKSMSFFLTRLIRYKSEYPSMRLSGDFTLLQRIIFTEMWLHEIDRIDVIGKNVSSKIIDSFTRLHAQLQKDIVVVGTTSKSERKDKLDAIQILLSKPASEIEERKKLVDKWTEENNRI